MLPPKDLTANEGFKNPLGFYDAKPVFSWKLPVADDVTAQSAYRIVVASDPGLLPDRADTWDSGKVESDQSAWMAFGGAPLQSRQAIYWQVMFWNQDGAASAWSDVARVETGLLANDDWQAEWISVEESNVPDASERGFQYHRPQYLRKDFDIAGPVEKARLYVTAKGLFEAQLNGAQVGRDRMTPGWTTYRKRIETLTYDVTDALNEGGNALGIAVGEGWYSGRISLDRSYKGPRPVPEALVQLEVQYRNGERAVIRSDATWRGTANGPIRYSDIYEGEDYDANLEMPGWSEPGFDASGWAPVDTAAVDADVRLVPKRHPAVTDKARVGAVAIAHPAPGITVFDLGQNIVGVAEVNIPVKKNQRVRIRFAEMLEDDGTLYLGNYRSARSTDFYIPKADGVIRWRPTFTFHGFRYVELSGFDDAVPESTDWVTGVVLHSDFDKAGTFSSSHAKLNQLQSNINWGLRGNFVDIPTDCPQRDERLGWTGDAQIFAATSLLNADVHAFWASWLQSCRDAQFADGGIPNIVPNIRGDDASSGWADAITVIPWELYVRTGDIRLLKDNYDAMKKLVAYYGMTADERVSNFRSYGDWLQPFTGNPEDARRGDTPDELTDAAYYAYSTQLTLNAARALGRDDDAAELEALLAAARADVRARFFDDDGRLTTPVETQTGYLYALAFDLVPGAEREKLVSHLVRTIDEADQHLRTGFLGTPLLAPVLGRHDRADLMVTMLFQETYPSWFYSINQGATTMWERWNSYSHEDGFGDAAMNSFNHYAYGAIGQWFFEGIAGIQALEPGYRKIRIAPTPDARLNSASAEYDSTYGRIASSWNATPEAFRLDVTIPPNTTAEIVIPVGSERVLRLDGADVSAAPGVAVLDRDPRCTTLHVGPGRYEFVAA